MFRYDDVRKYLRGTGKVMGIDGNLGLFTTPRKIRCTEHVKRQNHMTVVGGLVDLGCSSYSVVL